MDHFWWNNKKVLVTGHTGFKGSWLCLLLKSMNAKVFGYSLETIEDLSHYNISGISKKIDGEAFGDILDTKKLQNCINKFLPEIVIHCAAQALVIDAYKNPVYTFNTNVSGTVNLIYCCKDISSLKSLIIVTSDKVYLPQKTNRHFLETDRLGGNDPYSASKASCEIAALSTFNSFYENNNIGFATVRAGNVYGGGDWANNRLIPDICRSISQQHSIKIRNPESIRPWQYVLDPLYGYLKIAYVTSTSINKSKYNGSYNFGPKYDELDLTVLDIVKIAVKKWGSGSWEVVNQKDKFHETKLLSINSEKSQKMLNWKPKINIEEGLDITLDWYKNFKLGKNMPKVSDKYVSNFLNN